MADVVLCEQTYPVEWKRKAFFRFVDIFHSASWSQDLKAKVKYFAVIFSGCERR